jgi:hypothetical protein
MGAGNSQVKKEIPAASGRIAAFIGALRLPPNTPYISPPLEKGD